MSPDNKFKPISLKNTSVVVVWRRVDDLKKTKSFVKQVFPWSKIGEDLMAVMYDAGNLMVGYGIRLDPSLEKEVIGDAKAVVPKDAAARGGKLPLRVLADDACSGLALSRYDLVSNPASRFQVMTANFDNSVKQFNTSFKMTAAPVTTTDARSLTFLDDSGNFYSFVKPTVSAWQGKAKEKLGVMMKTSNELAKKDPKSSAVLSIDLVVSNLANSNEFYSKTLGLSVLSKTKDSIRFDLGTIILTLRQETSIGLVKRLAQTGRFSNDWIVFHAKDIRATTEGLAMKGVKFPAGIEESGIGDVAYFFDPDGHAFAIWQPSGKPTHINFYPVLNRLVR
ncbi:MAG TPA: VOC family protein [Pyrinomonadaceae bacterium]|nr:VOC family protein [Pyrinomonadaceae bacterium]